MRCETCRWWDAPKGMEQLEQDERYCIRFPPRPVPWRRGSQDIIWAAWPVTKRGYRCGEWADKETSDA